MSHFIRLRIQLLLSFKSRSLARNSEINMKAKIVFLIVIICVINTTGAISTVAIGGYIGAGIGAFFGAEIGIKIGANIGNFVGDQIQKLIIEESPIGPMEPDFQLNVGAHIGAGIGAGIGGGIGCIAVAVVGACIGAKMVQYILNRSTR